jgi:hypothetical protein
LKIAGADSIRILGWFPSVKDNSMVKRYWEIIADNLSKAGWSWGCVSAIDSDGRTIWIVDACATTESISL